jgi:uncharacterized protein YyaL (SSP411 family)
VYLEAATCAADFLKENLYNSETKTLKRVFLDGPGDTDGFSDDYAFLISGLIELYQATFKSEYLQWAHTLQSRQLDLFWDSSSGGFFRTSQSDEIVLRLKDDADSAEPSANSISVRNLLYLGGLLGEKEYDDRARKTCQAFALELKEHPWSFPSMLVPFYGAVEGIRQVVVIGRRDNAMTTKFLQMIQERVLVNTVVIHLDPDAPEEWLLTKNEVLRQAIKIPSEGQPFVTICREYTCSLPIFDLEKLDEAME